MKLDLKNTIAKQNTRHYGVLSNAKKNSRPIFSKNDDISFRGFDFSRIVDKQKGKVIYTNMDAIAAKIDGVLGDKFFTKTLGNAGLAINSEKQLQLSDTSILSDIWRTIKYPIVGLPLDLANWVAESMQKVSFLSDIAKKIQSIPILEKRAGAVKVEKSREAIRDILENFANGRVLGKSIENGVEFDSEKCLEKFKSNVASKLVKSAKNYSSRDERTLNRIATSTVSAIYGMHDFHNISMLQKDDKKEAKKAGKGRFKQEMLRMCFNAGTTFLMMGALDKYIKHSMPLSILTIGASAFLAEVVSRLISKTPLARLTPKEAEKIALKNHPELAESLKNSDNKAENRVNFKQKLEDTNKIFVQFQSKDGNSPAMQCLKQRVTTDSNKKKKISPLKVILGAVGVASAGYVISSALKGKYTYKKELKALFDANRDAINRYIENPENALDASIIDRFEEISRNYCERSKKFSIFEKLKELLTIKKVKFNAEDLTEKIKKLQNTAEGSKLKDILDKYLATINTIKNEPVKGGKPFMLQEERALAKGVYEGFAKLFNTVYRILSAPAALIEGIIDNTLCKESNKAAEIIGNRKVKTNFKKELNGLYSILKKSKVYEPEGIYKLLANLGLYKVDKSKAYESAAEEIVKNSRNLAETPETGDLANLSRTLVTAISTYFFVNDYTNKVLIESAGKDTQKAKEERNQRLAHKASNFVFNGTLMNLFNSVFVKPLNRSLLGATLVATATETTNEFLVRKSICQPVLPKNSKQEIIDFEQKQMSRKGILGAWSRFYRKITGKKSLTQKTGVGDKKVG